jgi:hypothetical protein
MTALELAAALPDPGTLRERCRMLAVLDTVLSSQSEYAYYSFDAHWAPGEELASMDNGSGDAYSIVFSPAGAFLRGFDHESPMSPYASDDYAPWPGLTTGIPPSLAGYVDEPAFHLDGSFLATVCLWREAADDRWHAGDLAFPEPGDADGSGWMFAVLRDPTSASYTAFAADYYERTVDSTAVAEFWTSRQLTAELLRRLNPEMTPASLIPDLARIGWPPPG